MDRTLALHKRVRAERQPSLYQDTASKRTKANTKHRAGCSNAAGIRSEPVRVAPRYLPFISN